MTPEVALKMKRRIARITCLVAAGATAITLPVALLLGPSNTTDGFRLFLGKNQDELVTLGTLEYPNEDAAHNHPCHRLAARLTTDRYGVLVAVAGGVMNEVVESLTQALSGQNPMRRENIGETMGDLAANWRGVGDSVKETLMESAGRR